MEEFVMFAVVGFVAQIIDSAIGMAYSITATSVLLNLGVTPAIASSTVHAAEVFTTGASGFSHWRLGNVRRDVFQKLMLPGVVGGAAGAYLLATIDSAALRPIMAGYLILMASIILVRALRRAVGTSAEVGHTRKFGLAGGFLDAIGGGGWGPLVTSTLISRGMTPRIAVGTSNAAEFFVTCAISMTFVGMIGLELWPIALGLIVGGTVAAPFGAYAARYLPDRALMLLVSLVVMVLGVRNLVQYFR